MNAGEVGQLRYGALFKTFGFLIAFAELGLVYVTFFTDHHGQYGALALLLAAFGFSAVYLLGEAFGTRGRFDPEGIEYETIWSGRKAQQWSTLREISFNRSMSWYVLSFVDGTTIRLPNMLSGLKFVLFLLGARGHSLRE